MDAQNDDPVESRLPGYRFGIVLLLLLVTFVFLASSPSGRWARLVGTILLGATLLAAMLASAVSRHVLRLTGVVVLVAIGSTIVSLAFDSSDDSVLHGSVLVLGALFIAVAPAVIARSIQQRGVIDAHTVLGAICVYVQIGMFFSVIFLAIGAIGSEPFFAQVSNATTADFLYFSFVTLTTVGYGDLTAAAGGVGRPLAALEALIGQLYLVVVLALLVSQFGRGRSRA